MLYILPPPSAPSPPSPWTTIMCAGGSGGGSGGSNYVGAGNNKIKTVTRSASWVTVNNTTSKKLPPAGRALAFKNRSKSRDSGTALLDDDEAARNSRSLSECYFAGKGAALVLPPNERLRPSRRVSASASGSDIQQHLQSMFYLLRPEETLKMAVKLESIHSGRTRYLVVVSCLGRNDTEESCLLGIDCNDKTKTTVGLVLRVLADTAIRLDGDGGFSVSVCGRQHIFKPVSVQAMWSALQTLHKVSSKARDQNYFQGGLTHDWVDYYEQHIESDRSCLNEWHAMDSIESRRPPSPDSVRTKPLEREETERVIRCTLKEIMMSVDLDEVTSKYIRGRLEEDLDVDLVEFKPFIDQEMLTILGQMDAATEIFDHVYLGSEWNASNLEELQKHGVRHILNVTREIDNFFPGMFNYLNVRVYDDEKTDLLKHWDNTFKYITRAKKEGSKVLVHCKMGVSRSASVVIAYAMKAYNWDFKKAFDHVKQKRSCIKPNTSFISQLETYQGILDAMKNREKLQRSKSETNLKSPGLVAKAEQLTEPSLDSRSSTGLGKRLLGAEWAWHATGRELARSGGRPKSWSPDDTDAEVLLSGNGIAAPTSVSLEQLNLDKQEMVLHKMDPPLADPSQQAVPPATAVERNYNLNVRMPCENGLAYSVSPNQVVYLPASCDKQAQDVEGLVLGDGVVPSVKNRVIELESQNSALANGKKSLLDRKGLVLNLTSQFETTSKSDSPGIVEQDCCPEPMAGSEEEELVSSHSKLAPQMLTAVLVKQEIWDPGEKESPTTCQVTIPSPSATNASDCAVWTSKTLDVQVPKLLETNDNKTYRSELKLTDRDTGEQLDSKLAAPSVVGGVVGRTLLRKEGDPFSNQLDRVFDREERKQVPPTLAAPLVTLPCLVEVPSEGTGRECPSRQSSWSSYDSAVVLGYQGEPRGDAPSRQSSWGSADTRCLPSRNSSWGSYDMRTPMQYVNERGEKPPLIEDFGSSSSGMFPYDRDEIPWYPGTVKRTKQKLEEGTVSTKAASSDTQPMDSSHVVFPSPHKTAETTVNMRIHGPRPYQNPTLVPSTGFSFPSAPLINRVRPMQEKSDLPTRNPLSHYASSPTLSHRETVTLKKMASSQPNITFNAESSPCAILTEPDLTALHPDSCKSLSASAPTPSALGLLGAADASRHPTVGLGSLPAMSPLGSAGQCVVQATQCASVKQHKRMLESLPLAIAVEKGSASEDSADETRVPISRSPEADATLGHVKNLKKEFEAKSVYSDSTVLPSDMHDSVKVKSLPSSPVSVHPSSQSPDPVSPSKTVEDLSVKMLVGKYEVSKNPTRPSGRTRLISENETVHRRVNCQTKSSLPQRKSSLEIHHPGSNNSQPPPAKRTSLLVNNLRNGSSMVNKRNIDISNGDELGRPPVPPVVRSMGPTSSVVVASVVAMAANKKQQQGRTHPLACLTITPRHNNPVYNTM